MSTYLALEYNHSNGPMLLGVIAIGPGESYSKVVIDYLNSQFSDLNEEELQDMFVNVKTFHVDPDVGRFLSRNFNRHNFMKGFIGCEVEALAEFAAHHALLWLLHSYGK